MIVGMPIRPVSVVSPAGEDVIARLRATVAALEGRGRQCVYPVPEALASLLPDGGLRAGAAYGVPAGALLLAMLATPSQDGAWCGVVGMPELGAEAAALAGVALDRLVLVPQPGSRWLAVTAALIDVLPVVALRPSGTVAQADAAKLAGRMRDKDAVLLVDGVWPGAEASLRLDEPRWSGVGDGWGYLAGREVTVRAASKRYATERSARVLLPGADGALQAADDKERGAMPVELMRAV